MPIYQHATYANETLTLQNPYMRVDFHKRATGWGWGEIFTPDGRCMAILDHLGELLLRDQEIPMRLEGETYQHERGSFGERLTFPLRSLIVTNSGKSQCGLETLTWNRKNCAAKACLARQRPPYER